MPSSEFPSYSSARVQRAYRTNNIEQTRLARKLQLLDREKIHRVRVTNQGIRTISLTLDYIQSCSGHSPEGLSPVKQESEDEDSEQDLEPCFLYGERIVSRKVRRFPRPQSAVDHNNSRRDSISSAGESTLSRQLRPQSSPTKLLLTTEGTTFRGDDSDTDIDSEKTESGRSSPRQAWKYDTSDITKKILRAQAERQRDRRISFFKREPGRMRRQSSVSVEGLSRHVSETDYQHSMPGSAARQVYAFPDMERRASSPFKIPASPVMGRNVSPPRRASASPVLDRRARIPEILNQRRATLSANDWRTHLNQNRSNPSSLNSQQQFLMDMKIRVNESRQDQLNEKVKYFKAKYPTRRPSTDNP